VSARVGTVAFVLLCLLGAASAVALTVREIGRTPAVVLSVVSTQRTGLTTTVTVDVRNTSDRARCVTVRLAARDRNGRDLGSVTVAGRLALAAGASRRIPTRLTLTARDYAERLDRFYPSARPCQAPESDT
jgi:hypothetical protein